MSESREEQFLLDNESMDEAHNIEDALQVSVDTTASSPSKRRLRSTESDSSNDKGGRSLSSDDSDSDETGTGGFGERPGTRGRGASIGGFGAVGGSWVEASSDEDSDEPPEIPGSPIAEKLQAGPSDGVFSAAPPSSRRAMMRGSELETKERSSDSESDEYETREVEQPRTAEFHASSSSEDEDEIGSELGSGRRSRGRNTFQTQLEQSALGRPKTAAKDLEEYRDVVPDDFFQQLDTATSVNEAETTPSFNAADKSFGPRIIKDMNIRQIISDEEDESDSGGQQQYRVYVPQEVEELFSLLDVYTPQDVEIGTRLEPFLPEFVPSVGLPFDGLQIPRPDAKEDRVGVDVLREPSGDSNVAELELLMQVSMASRNKFQRKLDVVRSIESAAQRPTEVDQWITSVAKMQVSKPPHQVNYKQSMPSLAQLMDLWPESFENFLTTQGTTILELGELDMSLPELTKLVCVVLDIPVYEGGSVQSLHVLFSLFLEIQAYERDAQRQQGSQR